MTALKNEVSVEPSRQAQFVSENEDDAMCASPAEMDRWLESHGLEPTEEVEETPSSDTLEVYVSGFDDGAVRHVARSAMESCLVAEEPTDHTHNSVTGERQ